MKLLIVLIFGSVTSSWGYYWRDYTGCIPDDAFVAGKDFYGRNIYIGQAYFKDKGIIVTQINETQPYVYVFINGKILKTYEQIKIFCGRQEDYYWLETTRSTYINDINGKEPIVGGREDGQDNYYIGRIATNKEQNIGKIIYNKNCNCRRFFYYHDNEEVEAKNFSVLMRKVESCLYSTENHNKLKWKGVNKL